MASTMPSIPQRRALAQPELRSWSELPARIHALLASEGIASPTQWLALPATRRAATFGVPRNLRRVLNTVAERELRS